MPVVYTGMCKGERFNTISHLVAPALALAGSAVLVAFAAMDGDTGCRQSSRRNAEGDVPPVL